MNRFNLSFSGEILPGEEPAVVKRRFGEQFAITDPDRLERFFSGETIILRRNLDRKTAAQVYQDMRRLGVVAELIKISAVEAAEPLPADPRPATAATDPARESAQNPPAAAPAGAEKPPGRRKRTRRKRGKRGAGRGAASRAQQPATEEAQAATPQERPPAPRKSRAGKGGKGAGRSGDRQPPATVAQVEAGSEAARQQAEKARAEAEREQARREAGEQARRAAAAEAARREAADEQARREAETRERARREAAEQAQRAAEEARARREAAEEAQRQAAARARAQAAEDARRERLRAEEARARQQAAEQAARQRILDEELARQARRHPEPQRSGNSARRDARPAGTPPAKRARTRLEVPRRGPANGGGAASPGRRQAGAPNPYALQAFRNTPVVRERAPRAEKHRRLAVAGAALGLAGVLALSFAYLRLPVGAPLAGAAGLTADPTGGLLLLAGENLLLHDRAGHGTGTLPLAALGVRSLSPPLAMPEPGVLLARGSLAGDRKATSQLLRCTLEPPGCEPFSPALRDTRADAFAVNRIDGSVLVADAGAGRLLRVAPGGDILATAEVPMPPGPVLRLRGGLLMMNSARGPAISVFRYDDSAFGEQLDEVLLLPPGADPEGLRTGDFLWQADAWWVSLRDVNGSAAAVHRFDSEWSPLNRLVLESAQPPLQLAAWGEKTLVNDGRQVAVWRFNRDGEAEVPLRSSLLQAQVEASAEAARWRGAARAGGFALLALLAAVCAGWGYVEHLRTLVYRGARPRGAEPLDEYIERIQWVPPQPRRRAALRRRGLSYAALALAGCLLAVGAAANAWELGALLAALAGPAAALWLLARQSPGHVGAVDKQLVLVDHGGTYHLGEGARVQFRGGFLLIDDVVVFTGNRLLPVFEPAALRALVAPRIRGGVRIDRKTLLVKLLQGRHPLAVGSLVIAGTCGAALVCLSLQPAL